MFFAILTIAYAASSDYYKKGAVILFLVFGAISAMLFMRNKIGLIASFGTLYLVASIVFFPSSDDESFVYFFNIIITFSSIMLLLIFSKVKRNVTKKIWFLPVIPKAFEFICVAYYLVKYSDRMYFYSSFRRFRYFNSFNLYTTLLLFIPGLIFMGLWIKESAKKSIATPINNANNIQNPPPYFEQPVIEQAPVEVNNSSSLDYAEELKKNKELLDLGILSQEEFDEMKEQILSKR